MFWSQAIFLGMVTLTMKSLNIKVCTFEKEFAEYCGASYALVTSSGTSAIMISFLAMGLKPGEEVIVTAYTFVATHTAIMFAGVVPVLAEIDESLNLDPEGIAQRMMPKTRAIVPVHMLGNPCDMDAIMGVACQRVLDALERSALERKWISIA